MTLIPHTAFLEPSLTGSTASVLHSGHPTASTPPHSGMCAANPQKVPSYTEHNGVVRCLSPQHHSM